MAATDKTFTNVQVGSIQSILRNFWNGKVDQFKDLSETTSQFIGPSINSHFPFLHYSSSSRIILINTILDKGRFLLGEEVCGESMTTSKDRGALLKH